MPLVTVTGIFKDQNGSFPDAGSFLAFALNSHFKAAAGHIVMPKIEQAAIDNTDGTWSVDLESTRDGIPSTRFYDVMFRGAFEGVDVNYRLGRIQLRETPTDQAFEDLIVDALIAEVAGQHVYGESPDAVSATEYQLEFAPLPDSEMVHVNEVYLVPGVGYTIESGLITLASPTISGDRVRVDYQKV